MPLLRDSRLRTIVAVILVIDGLVVAGGTWVSMLWLPYPLTLLLVPAAIIGASVAAWAVRRGRPTGWISVAGLAATGALHLGIAAVALWLALGAWGTRDDFATPPETAATYVAIVAVALLVPAALVASVRLPGPRWVAVALLAALGGLAAIGGGAAAALPRAETCGEFRFSADRWQAALRADARDSEEAELLAEAVVRCGVVEGRTRAEVRALLGRPDGGTRTWRWNVGWTNDFLGPGDGQDFLVTFGRDGRAGRGSLTYPDRS